MSNSNYKTGVAPGMIVAFQAHDNEKEPENTTWKKCDGTTTNIPNLKGLHIIGASGPNETASPANPYPLGKSGGSTTIKILQENVPDGFPELTNPEHQHPYTTPNIMSAYIKGGVPSGVSCYEGITGGVSLVNQPVESSKCNLKMAVYGKGINIDHEQPYYSLHFYQKV